jgi:hypothetical protein
MTTRRGRYFGKVVHVSTELERLRETDCLCLNCRAMGSCPIAKTLYQICKRENLALGVSRCPIFQRKR